MPDVDVVGGRWSATLPRSSLGAVYYGVLGDQLGHRQRRGGRGPQLPAVDDRPSSCALPGRSPPVVAGLAVEGDVDAWRGGLVLGLALWVGFPLVLWVGAMLHEKTPCGSPPSTPATGW